MYVYERSTLSTSPRVFERRAGPPVLLGFRAGGGHVEFLSSIARTYRRSLFGVSTATPTVDRGARRKVPILAGTDSSRWSRTQGQGTRAEPRERRTIFRRREANSA